MAWAPHVHVSTHTVVPPAVRPRTSLAQGLADTFLLLGMPFDSPEAAELNTHIFETMYYAALKVGGTTG